MDEIQRVEQISNVYADDEYNGKKEQSKYGKVCHIGEENIKEAIINIVNRKLPYQYVIQKTTYQIQLNKIEIIPEKLFNDSNNEEDIDRKGCLKTK